MTQPLRQIDGIFIDFAPGELKAIQDFLTDLDYPPDGRGIKEFILDSIEDEARPKEDSTDRIIKQVSGFINSNPATVKAGLNMAAAVLGKIKKAGSQARPGPR